MEWERLYFHIFSPLLQICILALLIYWLLLALERVSAGVKLRGLALSLGLLVLTALGSHFAGMYALSWVLQNAISASAIILAIVFQSELRRLFTRVGGIIGSQSKGDNAMMIDQLVTAVEYLAARRIGALVVIQRNDHLDDYIAAQPLDAQITSKLLCTIFWKDSPLHDGALIIAKGRIAAAGVILPLTENFAFKDLSGTRHRAGIGISEDTDALAILVSEESGIISIADRGAFQRNLSVEDLRILLVRTFRQRGGEQEGIG